MDGWLFPFVCCFRACLFSDVEMVDAVKYHDKAYRSRQFCLDVYKRQDQKPESNGFKTVAFCGCQPRIGTTTQAVQFAKYLQFSGLSVCYIEANENHHVEAVSYTHLDVYKRQIQ